MKDNRSKHIENSGRQSGKGDWSTESSSFTVLLVLRPTSI
jgi:hypothetical protein